MDHYDKRQMISIHAPREGGDCILWPLCLPVLVFQSTPPARGATYRWCSAEIFYYYFNPRPPRGGRLTLPPKFLLRPRFQSTPPARGATTTPPYAAGAAKISIHAPREGGDRVYMTF